ncbi:MAG: thioesterase family protein [Bryobacteraceae bacterium]
MAAIPVGAKGEHRITVHDGVAIDFLGTDDARVLGTPYLIAFLEMTSRDLVKPMLGPGKDTVGTHVDVRHLAATPIGMEVRFEAEVIEVDEPRIRFRVKAFDEHEKIAEGTHERYIIDIERFAGRVRGKAAGQVRPGQ